MEKRLGPGQPVKTFKKEIPSEIEELLEHIQILKESWKNLTEILLCIVPPDPDTNPKGGEGKKLKTQMGTTIYSVSMEIKTLAEEINDFSDRIEL